MKRALVLAVVLSVMPAAVAHARSYVVQTCGTGAINNAWDATTPPAGIMEVNESCLSTWPMGGAWVRDVLASPTSLTDGQGAWLVFQAPAGTTISAITYKRWLWKEAIEDLQPTLRTGEDVVLETCSIPVEDDRCDVGGVGTAVVSHTGLDTGQLIVGVGCEISGSVGSTCPGGGTQHGYGAVIYDAAVTIEDETAPAAPSVEADGLWSGAPWHKGASSITVSASDASGIEAVRVYRDGVLFDEQPLTCDWSRPRPCDDVADMEIAVDTTALPDGEREIGIATVDAAGNESVPTTRAVTIANDAPAAPQLVLTPTQGTSPTFLASWTPATGHPVAIAVAHITVCHEANCVEITEAGSRRTLTAPGPGVTTVSVYLEDVAGNLDPGQVTQASFSLAAPPPGGGDPPGNEPPGPTPRRPAHLRIKTVVRSEAVAIRVRLASRAHRRVTVAIRWRHSTTRPPWTTTMRRRLPVRDGRAAINVRRRSGARRLEVIVTYPGDKSLRPATQRRVVRLPAAR